MILFNARITLSNTNSKSFENHIFKYESIKFKVDVIVFLLKMRDGNIIYS